LTMGLPTIYPQDDEVLRHMNTERQAWLADLYESNFAPIFRTCSRVLKNPDDAADASQEVFLIAANSLPPGTGGAIARAWLQTVARNHCLDVLRRRKRFGKVLVTLGADGDESGDIAATVADRDFVGAIFKRLSPVERQALWHSAVEHRAVNDIASRLQLSYMAAAQVIHRARRHALQFATRVAIVLGIIRLSRSANRPSFNFVRAAALPMIAVSAIAMQTSVGPTAADSTMQTRSLPAISRTQAGPILTGGRAVSAPPAVGRAPALQGVLPSSPSSTINAAVNAIQQSLHIPTPVPVPGIAVPVPSLPAIPPTPNPNLP